MKLDSYWLDTAPVFSEGAEGPVDGRADVVVIGGGFTGLSAALELATRGVSVTVLEAGRIASEASGRNGGQCHTGVAQGFASRAERVGLAQAATRHGARIFEGAAVTQLKRIDGERYELTSARGVIRADQVLVATGPSRLGPLQWFQRRMAPVGSFIVVTEPLSKQQLDA